MFGLTLLIFPVCLLKDISKMRFASMFGICALIYSILVVVIESPWFFSKKDLSEANWFNISNGFKIDDTNILEFFNAIATVFFIYSCHPGAFPVYKSLKFNFPKRINTVFLRSIILDLIIYLLVAICGFITNPKNPPDLIVYREAKNVFSNDIFMNIAKISLALDLYLSIPANYNSLRASFFLLFFKTDKIDNGRNLLVTLPILLVGTFIGVVFNDILSYISLLGGFCSSAICLLIPCFLMVRTSKQEIFSPRNIFRIVVLGALCFIGFTAGILTIIGMIVKKK
jgi:amino acid permease